MKKASSSKTTTPIVNINEKYGQCKRNFLVKSGGYLMDGCMEFMVSRAGGPNAELTCDACGCHRSFHKKEWHFSEAVVSTSSAQPPKAP